MSNKAGMLVAEDETSVAMVMVFLPTRAGGDVQTAWNAEKGMRLVQDAEDHIAQPVNVVDFVSRILSCVKPEPARHKTCPLDVPDEDTDTNTKRLGNTP